uniref:Uncharacterized protein n=1 Tax=Psilocybe cubensis TaxID=181762 RepID=A0A8H8CJ61_PSICU
MVNHTREPDGNVNHVRIRELEVELVKCQEQLARASDRNNELESTLIENQRTLQNLSDTITVHKNNEDNLQKLNDSLGDKLSEREKTNGELESVRHYI